jgi:hypothetical protein
MSYLISIQARTFRFISYGLIFVLACVISPSVAYNNDAVSWESLPGLAVDIAINSNGQTYITAPDGTPWRWAAQEKRWSRMSGRFTRIAAAEDNHPWAVNNEGELLRYNGLWWEIKNKNVTDVAANSRGDVFIVMNNGDIKHWYALRSEWRPITGSAKRIALGNDGQPWVINSEGKVQSYDGKNWRVYSNTIARDIAIGGEDTQVIVDSTGALLRWDKLKEKWSKVDGIDAVKLSAVTPSGDIWAVSENGEIIINGELASNADKGKAKTPKALVYKAPSIRAIVKRASSPKATVVTATGLKGKTPTSAITQITSEPTFNGPAINPITVTSRGAINFVNTRQTAASLAIGGDGSVFALTAGGSILRWSNSANKFADFPGALIRIAVDKEGHPWGISALGRVFRHTGKQWKQLLNLTASDISIGYDGTILIVGISGRIFKLNDGLTGFYPVTGNNVALVAVAPDGTPWAVRTDKQVQRCDSSPCKLFPQKAQSISIGPDGSVYIISESKKLMRLDHISDSFKLVSVPGYPSLEDVAVGPQGFPWVTSSDDLTLASKFFERDEGGDSVIAAMTPAGGTVGTGSTLPVVSTEVSGVTFSKNMKFQNITHTSPIGTGDFNILEVGNDGSIWLAVLIAADNRYEKYNESRNRFEPVSFWFATNNVSETAMSFDLTSNGDFWGISNLTNVYRVRGQQAVDFTKNGLGLPEVLSVGGDDTVYVVYGTTLYSKAANSNQFKKFSNDNDVKFVTAGSASDVWITNTANQVQQWNGSAFENRPVGKTQLAESVKASSGGAVYIVEAGIPYKWNGTNNSFDKINNIQLTADGEAAIEADGRLWLVSETDNTVKRAKD